MKIKSPHDTSITQTLNVVRSNKSCDRTLGKKPCVSVSIISIYTVVEHSHVLIEVAVDKINTKQLSNNEKRIFWPIPNTMKHAMRRPHTRCEITYQYVRKLEWTREYESHGRSSRIEQETYQYSNNWYLYLLARNYRNQYCHRFLNHWRRPTKSKTDVNEITTWVCNSIIRSAPYPGLRLTTRLCRRGSPVRYVRWHERLNCTRKAIHLHV